MKFLPALLWLVLFALPASSQTTVHTIHWEKGVNKKVVKEWAGSLDKVSTASSTTYIVKKVGGKDKLHRSGHRDVIVWIPGSADLTKDFIAIIWFHGHWGYVPGRTFENRTLKQFVPLVDSKNFVVVIPEMPWSVHTTTPTKRNSLLWQKPGDFIKFVAQTENTLLNHAKSRGKNARRTEESLGKIDYRIVGHSAGGSTIKRLGITGDLCRVKPSMVVWSDSSYGQWLSNAWDHCLSSHRKILVKVFVAKGGSPWLRANQFMSRLPAIYDKPPKNLELHIMKPPRWSHKLIGDNIVKLSGILE